MQAEWYSFLVEYVGKLTIGIASNVYSYLVGRFYFAYANATFLVLEKDIWAQFVIVCIFGRKFLKIVASI